MPLKNLWRLAIMVVLGLTGIRFASAATVLVGVEDTPGASGYESNGDFNDMIFDIKGNFTMNNPGGVFTNLTPSVVNENGTVFWDHKSLDGPDENVGYCLLGNGNCPALVGGPFGTIQYLATPTGGSVDDVTFDATGAVTVQLNMEVAGWASKNLLGWYSLSDPGVLHPLIPGTDAFGTSITFDPDGTFAFYFVSGGGETYSSISSANVGDSATQQHFAFFADPLPTPEPETAYLAGVGMLLLMLGSWRRKRVQERS